MTRVYNKETGKMEEVSKKKGDAVKVSVNAELATKLEAFATEDGYSFEGISYVTQKDKDGKTKKGTDGKPLFVMESGKVKVVTIERSQAKVNSAIADYVNAGINLLIENREKAGKK